MSRNCEYRTGVAQLQVSSSLNLIISNKLDHKILHVNQVILLMMIYYKIVSGIRKKLFNVCFNLILLSFYILVLTIPTLTTF